MCIVLKYKLWFEWVLFNAKWAIIQLYHVMNKLHFDETNMIFIVLAHWKNSSRVDMSLHSDTLSWFHANQSLLLLLNVLWLAEKQQISIL
jgi:hypothetical protein